MGVVSVPSQSPLMSCACPRHDAARIIEKIANEYWIAVRNFPLRLISMSESSVSFQLFVEHERVYDRSEGGNENCSDGQPERRTQNHDDQAEQASGEKSFRGEAVSGVPHLFVGDGPRRTDADEEIAAHFAEDIAEQREEEADTAFEGATD